jgi:hypothetical protein
VVGLIPYLQRLVDEFSGRINSLFVYTLEAHAANEWPVNSNIVYNQTTILKDRLSVATDFIDSYKVKIPVVLDSCSTNDFSNVYASWPVRFYIIHQGKLTFIAQPVKASFALSDIYDALNNVLSL